MIHSFDLVLLLIYLGGVIAFGSWMGRQAKNTVDYMLGGRDLPWWLILFSIVATETSTVTFLSIPGFAFTRDFTWLQIPIGFLIGRLVVGQLLLPHYFRGKLFTAYQVLHQRFGGATEQVASVMFILTRSLADGLRLFLSAIVLQEMTGLALPWAVAAVGTATILYTFVGGMRAVVWTDLVQFVLYIVGGVVALAVIIDRLPGGWEQLVAIGGEAGKWRVFDLRLDFAEAYGLWAGLFGGVFISLGSHGVDQLMVQRFLAARGFADARRALSWSGVVALIQFALFLLIGVGLFAFYQVFTPATALVQSDRVFAHFIVNEMPSGILGLLLGAVFAAAMSTLSSSLNSCATAAVKDLYLPWTGGKASTAKQLRLTRWLTVAFGGVQIAVGIAGQGLTSSTVSSILGIAAFTTGIVLGVFFLGIFTRRVGQRAALTGLVIGLLGMTWIFFATPLAWPWFALVGSAGTFIAGLLASLVWPRQDAKAARAPS